MENILLVSIITSETHQKRSKQVLVHKKIRVNTSVPISPLFIYYKIKNKQIYNPAFVKLQEHHNQIIKSTCS